MNRAGGRVQSRGVCAALLLLAVPRSAWAQGFATTVRGAVTPDDTAAVSRVDLGLPGERGAPSAGKTSLAEALVGQPGLQVRSAGGLGQWSGALLRGADASQVAILIDGVPLQRGGQSAIDLSQLPIDGLERVEVYRSLPPLSVGIDAIGGAINLITRKGRGAPSFWGVLGTGSFGLRKAAAGVSGEGADGLRTTATISYQGATGDFPYLSDGGLLYSGRLVELVRRNDDFDQLNVDVRIGHDGPRGGFFVATHGLLKSQGVAGIGQASAQPGQPRLQVGRALASAGGYRLLSEGRLRVGVDAHVLLEGSALQDLGIVPAARYEQLSAQVGFRSVVSLASRTRNARQLPVRTWTLQVDGRVERFRSSDLCPAPRTSCAGAEPTESQRLRLQLSAGGDLRLFDDALLVQPALHVLAARSSLQPLSGTPGTDQTLDGNALFAAPRLAARWQIRRGWLLRLGGGRFARVPTFLELFGDRAFFRANLDLRPETAWVFELGSHLALLPLPWLSLEVEAHGFARQIDDLIDLIRDGATLRARNVGQAIAAGSEAELRVSLADRLRLQLNYSLLLARDATEVPGRGGNVLPGRPAHTLFLRLEANYRLWRLAYDLDYRSAIFLDPANGRQRPDRVLHALSLQAGPYSRARLSLGLEVRNLADTRSVDIALPLSASEVRAVPLSDLYDYPLPGRSIYATLAARY